MENINSRDEFDFDDDFNYGNFGEEERLAELDAFLEMLAEMEREYYSKSKLFVLDLVKFKEFKDSVYQINKFIKDNIYPRAKIEFEPYDLNCIPIKTDTSINFELKELFVKDVKNFIDSIKTSSNISIIPLLNGKIRIYIQFKNIIKEVKVDNE